MCVNEIELLITHSFPSRLHWDPELMTRHACNTQDSTYWSDREELQLDFTMTVNDFQAFKENMTSALSHVSRCSYMHVVCASLKFFSFHVYQIFSLVSLCGLCFKVQNWFAPNLVEGCCRGSIHQMLSVTIWTKLNMQTHTAANDGLFHTQPVLTQF